MSAEVRCQLPSFMGKAPLIVCPTEPAFSLCVMTGPPMLSEKLTRVVEQPIVPGDTAVICYASLHQASPEYATPYLSVRFS